MKGCKCIVENSTFSANHDAGVVAEEGSSVHISGSKFSCGKGCGVVFDNSVGVVAECTLTENVCSGVMVTNRASPILWKNTITNGESAGITISESSQVHIEDNTFAHNEDSDVQLSTGAYASLTANCFNGGQTSAIHLCSRSSATIDFNSVRNYAFTGVSISGPACSSSIYENTFEREGDSGCSAICIKDASFKGRVLDNMLVGWGDQQESMVLASPVLVSSSPKGGREEVDIRGNIARPTEALCCADKLMYMMSHG